MTTTLESHFNIRTHNGCITIKNPATGNHRTFRIKTQKQDANFAPGQRILSLLTGPDNTHSYQGFAFVKDDGKILLWRRYHGQGPWAKYINMLISPEHFQETGGFEYHIEGSCRRCNRKLTVPESIQSGIGPVCAKL